MMYRSDEICWATYSPPAIACGAENPAWLEELRAFRGTVLYGDGRRPQFRLGDGRLCDADPADVDAHHVVARLRGEIVGCIRFLPASAGTVGLAESLLGAEGFDLALGAVGSDRESTVDAGRWVARNERCQHPIGVQLVAAGWAYLLHSGFKTAISVAGTRNGQDRLLSMAGLEPIVGLAPIRSELFDDDLRIMYANLARPNRGFAGLIREMAQAIGIDGLLILSADEPMSGAV